VGGVQFDDFETGVERTAHGGNQASMHSWMSAADMGIGTRSSMSKGRGLGPITGQPPSAGVFRLLPPFHGVRSNSSYINLNQSSPWFATFPIAGDTGHACLRSASDGFSKGSRASSRLRSTSSQISHASGGRMKALSDLSEALAGHASHAAEKLRSQNGVCHAILVFIHTNPFREQDPQYSNSRVIPLPNTSADTRLLMRAALFGLKKI
jgi:hypothetical protein